MSVLVRAEEDNSSSSSRSSSTGRLVFPSCSRPVLPAVRCSTCGRPMPLFFVGNNIPSLVGSTVHCRCGSARCDVRGEVIFYLRCRVAAGTGTGCLSYLDAAWSAESGAGAAMNFAPGGDF